MERPRILNYDAEAILKLGGGAFIIAMSQNNLEGLEGAGATIIGAATVLGGVASGIEAVKAHKEAAKQYQIEYNR